MRLSMRKELHRMSVKQLHELAFSIWTALDHALIKEDPDPWASVRGQEHIKRAITVAAVRSHPVLLYGSPGVGKALLAAGGALLHVPVLSTWPCPCGYYGHPSLPCNCTPASIDRWHLRRIRPLQDRAVIHVTVPPAPVRELIHRYTGTTIAQVKARLREITTIPSDTPEQADETSRHLLEHAGRELVIQANDLRSIWSVAQSVSALDGETTHVTAPALLEAIQYSACRHRFR